MRRGIVNLLHASNKDERMRRTQSDNKLGAGENAGNGGAEAKAGT